MFKGKVPQASSEENLAKMSRNLQKFLKPSVYPEETSFYAAAGVVSKPSRNSKREYVQSVLKNCRRR